MHRAARARYVDHEHAEEVVGQAFVLVQELHIEEISRVLAIERRMELAAVQILECQDIHLDKAELLRYRWENHGEWVSEVEPALGPGIKERFEWASTIGPEQVDLNLAKLGRVRSRLDELLQDAELLCLPTVPRVAPLRNTRVDLKEVTYRNQAMCLLCIAGLGGLPQVSLPMARIDGLPIGLSLIGPRGSDTTLLALAREALGAGSPV